MLWITDVLLQSNGPVSYHHLSFDLNGKQYEVKKRCAGEVRWMMASKCHCKILWGGPSPFVKCPGLKENPGHFTQSCYQSWVKVVLNQTQTKTPLEAQRKETNKSNGRLLHCGCKCAAFQLWGYCTHISDCWFHPFELENAAFKAVITQQ